MKIILKSLGLLILGILIGSFINMGFIIIGDLIFIKPEDFNPFNAMNWDIKYFIFPFIAHAFGTFSGSYSASKLSNNDNKNEFRVALSPEGTRQRVEKFKTGFYYIAKKANVPIIMFTLNFKDKEILISEPFYTTDNMQSDFNYIEEFFDGVEGKVKELSFYKS